MKAGRQLLVAMIEATSGERFEEKAFGELNEMEAVSKRVYAVIASASALGFSVSKNELLISLGDASNESLDILERLLRRGVLTTAAGDQQSFRARHRVIAEIIFDKLQADGQLYECLVDLALAAATQQTVSRGAHSKPGRLLKKILNHNFLHRCFAMTRARQFYEELVTVLRHDHHFWLQRGSLELEDGYLKLAQNFIGQAESMKPDDPLVACTAAHLLFRRGLENVSGLEAKGLVDQAVVLLKGDIARRGDRNYGVTPPFVKNCTLSREAEVTTAPELL
jgi:hypothetical protein